ncbi:MAG: ABC transporter ATP-binding protein [Candidatus Latescibacteria bacterium]|nr:ABC transporter ATP-binding protein [Candidatus Latescibacterota bacterium]
MLKVENINKLYRSADGVVRAVDGVSVAVEAGEFIAVQGPSGCGKTTLLLSSGGLLAPDGGTVTVGGTRPYDLSPDVRARFRAETVGFVFQRFHLVPYMSVLENVLSPATALPAPDSRDRAEALIERFNLGSRRKHLPSELSTGERQRTALARALLNGPKLLLADEPTGNLDGDNADIVLSTFEDFTRAGGAVLMVTHSEDAALRADRVIHLRDGRIVR